MNGFVKVLTSNVTLVNVRSPGADFDHAEMLVEGEPVGVDGTLELGSYGLV